MLIQKKNSRRRKLLSFYGEKARSCTNLFQLSEKLRSKEENHSINNTIQPFLPSYVVFCM